jgi:alkane 1-monooxygenase
MERESGKSFLINYAVLSIVSAILFTALIFFVYGVQGGVLFVLEALGSIFYLEAINYIEHYGLLRKRNEKGEYEKVTIRHSWNAPHRISNYLLFKLQRHSDHH